MSIDTLIRILFSKKAKHLDRKNPRCECELYETGDQGLNLVGWHPALGAEIYLPNRKLKNHWIDNDNSEDDDFLYTEIHTNKKVIGCHFNFANYSSTKQTRLMLKLYNTWGIT
jgi:hypothetical protein